jgi:hypothetical protein
MLPVFPDVFGRGVRVFRRVGVENERGDRYRPRGDSPPRLSGGAQLRWIWLVCRTCSTAWRCKSSTQCDGDEGYRWVVDLDLEKFFNRVNHDRLMAAVAERVADKRMLKLM